jgi:hypothetical protein
MLMNCSRRWETGVELGFGLLGLINYDLGGNNKVKPGKLHAWWGPGVLHRNLKILIFKNELKASVDLQI